MRQDVFPDFLIVEHAARLHVDADAGVVQFLTQFADPFREECRLSPADGDPAAGHVEEDFVRDAAGHDLIHGHLDAHALKSLWRAGLCTEEAVVTDGPVHDTGTVRTCRTQGTNVFTGKTADALIHRNGQFRAGFFALRVMAPDTVKRTAFKENGSPDAGTVVQRVGFQFQYERSFHVITPQFGTIVILTLVILTQRALLFYWQNIQVFGPVSVQNSKNCFRIAEAVSSVLYTI